MLLTETVKYDRQTVSRPLSRALKGRSEEGQVALGPEGPGREQEAEVSRDLSDTGEEEPGSTIIVLASGNLGLVYGTQRPERATLEQIEEYFPGMLDGLAQHEGVGFVQVHSEVHGPVVIGGEGRYYLNEDRIEGENPLAGFDPNAARHLRRNDSFPDAPDLYVSSFYDPETNE